MPTAPKNQLTHRVRERECVADQSRNLPEEPGRKPIAVSRWPLSFLIVAPKNGITAIGHRLTAIGRTTDPHQIHGNSRSTPSANRRREHPCGRSERPPSRLRSRLRRPVWGRRLAAHRLGGCGRPRPAPHAGSSQEIASNAVDLHRLTGERSQVHRVSQRATSTARQSTRGAAKSPRSVLAGANATDTRSACVASWIQP